VKIILVELPYKRREVGMLEVLRQDCLREFVHILLHEVILKSAILANHPKTRDGLSNFTYFDDKAVILGSPCDDVLELVFFKHSV